MKSFLLLICFAFPFLIDAQTVTIKFCLNATEGGVHSNMNVTLVDINTQAKFSGKTDVNGNVSIVVPANSSYEVKIPNYTSKKIINVPNAPGATMNSSMTYSKNMVAEEAAFAMDASEKAEVDAFANGLPDTTHFLGYDPFTHFSETFYTNVELVLSDFTKGPLRNEVVTLTGRKRHKSFKGTTDASGKLKLYLPKGDEYDMSFYYHKNYESTECNYSKGITDVVLEFEYIGTKEFARRKKEEEDRMAKEAAIAKAQAQATKDAILNQPYEENDVAAVFDRNKFSNPLVICDASTDMRLILDELQGWFAKNEKSNPTSQFVFFNDAEKKTETNRTGGFYYTPALALDALMVFITTVINKGDDNDSPDNYVEALIKGVAMAKQPYGDIVLIVDNHATARDISMLPQFTGHPVHVVVFCSIKGGCDHSYCQPDYLKIAWTTKGTLHIDGNDYNDIGKMKNGESIRIGEGGRTFKLTNGEFFETK